MGIRDRYVNGVFNWVDLATNDPDAAKTFYSQLLGWTFQDLPAGEYGTYSMAFKGDRPVAALFDMGDEMRAQGIPPHWQSYINVEDLATTVQAWQTHGGEVLNPGAKVMDAGHIAVVKDPTGAVVCLWQPLSHIGAGVVNEAETFCWAELQTRGAAQAAEFFQRVFGWEIEHDQGPNPYIMASVAGHANCGFFDLAQANLPPEIPPAWQVYFNVTDLDQALDRAKAIGGKAMMEPMKVDVGRFAMITDPQGSAFILIQLEQIDD